MKKSKFVMQVDGNILHWPDGVHVNISKGKTYLFNFVVWLRDDIAFTFPDGWVQVEDGRWTISVTTPQNAIIVAEQVGGLQASSAIVICNCITPDLSFGYYTHMMKFDNIEAFSQISGDTRISAEVAGVLVDGSQVIIKTDINEDMELDLIIRGCLVKL